MPLVNLGDFGLLQQQPILERSTVAPSTLAPSSQHPFVPARPAPAPPPALAPAPPPGVPSVIASPSLLSAPVGFSAGIVREEVVDLTSLWPAAVNGYPLVKKISGQRLYYRRGPSTPGGRLNIKLDGVPFQHVGPGTRITIPFSQVEIGLSPLSVFSPPVATSPNRAYAYLDIFGDAALDFEEDAEALGTPGPVDLLGKFVGSVSAGNVFVTIPEDTRPALQSNIDLLAADVTGWRKIRVIVSGGGTAIEAGTLTPWFSADPQYFDVTGEWIDASGADSTARINLELGADAAAVDLRTFVVDLAPMMALASPAVGSRWYLLYEVTGLLPGASTGVGMAIQGIE